MSSGGSKHKHAHTTDKFFEIPIALKEAVKAIEHIYLIRFKKIWDPNFQ